MIRINFFIDLSKALKGSGIYSSAIRLQKGLKKTGLDVRINNKKFCEIVHVHTALPTSYLKLSRILSNKKHHYPIIIIHGHTTVEDFVNSFILSNQLRFFLKWYLPRFYKKADYLIAVSPHNKHLLLNYGVPPEKITIISNGIDLNVKYLSQSLRKKSRIALGLSDKQTLVIGLGVCIYRKGIDRFIDIAQKMPELRFIWIGKRIPTPFLAHASYIKNKFKKTPSNCRFAGYVSHNTLLSLFSASDIFLFPTREENQGIAFLEAILYNKPAVISDHPVFEEYKDQVHVLKASNIEQFVDKINLLVNDQDLQKTLVKNSKSHLQNHDIKNSIDAISKLYKRANKNSRKL